jgi:putative salt-induced outer membrane protein YdiY
MAEFLLAALLVLAPGTVRDEKTDLVILENGNELLGEIKSMSRGKLKFKTDSASTIYIEWDEVFKLTSKHRFRIELLDGTHLVGTFLDPPEDQSILLLKPDGTQELLAMSNISRLTEFDQSARERLDGYVDAGFSFNKSTTIVQYTFGGGLSYFSRERSISADLSAIVTDQDNEDKARRLDLTTSYRRLYSKRWFGAGIFTMNHNTELALDLRATLGAGPGRYLIQTQSQELSTFVGLAYSYEVPEGAPSDTKWEGVIGTTYDIFITDTPETVLGLNTVIYPGITETDRLRMNLNFELSKEIVEDFFFKVSYYLDYDSQPTSDDGKSSDYGVSTGLSYTF